MPVSDYPPEVRLRLKREIDAVYKKGRRLHGPLFRLHVLANDLGRARLGVSVPGRLCNAVLRNRWKRLLRESFRLHCTELPAVDILAIPRRPPVGLNRQDAEAELLRLLAVRSGPAS